MPVWRPPLGGGWEIPESAQALLPPVGFPGARLEAPCSVRWHPPGLGFCGRVALEAAGRVEQPTLDPSGVFVVHDRRAPGVCLQRDEGLDSSVGGPSLTIDPSRVAVRSGPPLSCLVGGRGVLGCLQCVHDYSDCGCWLIPLCDEALIAPCHEPQKVL